MNLFFFGNLHGFSLLDKELFEFGRVLESKVTRENLSYALFDITSL